MMERRRIARPTGPSISTPSLSGPRCTRASFIAASAPGFGLAAPPSDTRPQMPHMSDGGWPPERGAGASPQDAPGGSEHHAEVERDGAGRDVLEVMGKLVGPGLLGGHAGLGEPGQAGPHDQPLPVLGDLCAELLEELGPGRAGRAVADVA